KERVRLIAGGMPKHESYEPAKRLLAQRAAGVYLIGEAADAMAEAWQSAVPCVKSRTLEQAVREALEEARPGETLLLSPGCASLDQFHNFGERGNRFIEYLSFLEGWKERKNT
ncbi:UDP-N-acetylmuramoyl-L-alanine--D-glutamate ligase, partial [Verrucomicrobiota bacterium]